MSENHDPATFDPMTRTWTGTPPEPTSTALYSQMCVPHGWVGDRPCPECAADAAKVAAEPAQCRDGTHQGFCASCGRCQCGAAKIETVT